MDKNGFAHFDGFHPSRSSDISLLPTEGIIQKIKEGRKGFYRSQEYFALHLWDRLTQHYNREYSGVKLLSPRPIAVVPDKNAILMSLVPGFDLSRLPDESIADNSIVEDLGIKLGYLFHVKSTEGLSHGDFQPRHLIKSNNNHLGVIDVENSKYTINNSSLIVAAENQRLVAGLLMLPAFASRKEVLLDGIRQGGLLITKPESVIEDLIRSIYAEIGIGSSKFRTRSR